MKDTARISEYFCSFQGEGPWAGVKQFFIRFHGCNLNCEYCDTSSIKQYKIFTVQNLVDVVLKEQKKNPFREISLTGGEPLNQADFIARFLKELSKKHLFSIYLETNSSLPKALGKVHRFIDRISADFKLASSGNTRDLTRTHVAFFRKLCVYKKDFFIKCIVNNKTQKEEFRSFCRAIQSCCRDRILVLQPEMKGKKVCISQIKLGRLYDIAENHGINARIIPQIHKILNFP